jgi:hypothetical protein
MKNIATAILLACGFVSCEDSLHENPECLEVSIISELCGNAILKIENPLYYYLGETANGHNNVFLTSFNCEDIGKEKDGTFYVELVDDNQSGACADCLAIIDYQGDKKYPVKIVEACDVEVAD